MEAQAALSRQAEAWGWEECPQAPEKACRPGVHSQPSTRRVLAATARVLMARQTPADQALSVGRQLPAAPRALALEAWPLAATSIPVAVPLVVAEERPPLLA